MLKISGTDEIVEIPSPLLDIRSTPSELISKTNSSAVSPASSALRKSNKSPEHFSAMQSKHLKKNMVFLFFRKKDEM